MVVDSCSTSLLWIPNMCLLVSASTDRVRLGSKKYFEIKFGFRSNRSAVRECRIEINKNLFSILIVVKTTSYTKQWLFVVTDKVYSTPRVNRL